MERCWSHGGVRVTAHAPPRHGKTELVLVFLALTIVRHPEWTCAYVTYEANLAYSKSRKVRQMVEAMGVELVDDANRLGEWRTKQGGGLLATGIGGPLTGQGVNVLVVDDPYKNRQQAESAAYQRTVKDWWADVGRTRLEPKASAIVFHTRWVKNDLIGYLHKQNKKRANDNSEGALWSHVHMPALDPANDNAALWPERYSAEELQQIREDVGEYTWWSLYQGRPRPRGKRVFNGTYKYSSLPATYSLGIGIDCAYTSKTKSDKSCAVVIAADTQTEQEFIVHVLRGQYSPNEWVEKLAELHEQYPNASWRWHASGTERGIVPFIEAKGIPLEVVPALTDKFTRAIPVAAKWNKGLILVPEQAEWLEDFLEVIHGFVGSGDKEDDDVDALASADSAVEFGCGFSIAS